MGANHDLLADKAGRAIVSNIINKVDNWEQIFSNSIYQDGDFEWPRPDYVCVDAILKQSIAFEFKPPNQTKREYLTGLGQTISYLQKHHYSGIILPEVTEGYEIAKHLARTLELDIFSKHHIAVISYNEKTLESNPLGSIKLIKSIDDIRTGEIIKIGNPQTYWCWWRDISHYEVFTLLDLLDLNRNKEGDIYSKYAWPSFWKMLIGKQTRMWDGSPRIKSGTSESQEKQNYKISPCQLGLFEKSKGKLTTDGYKLLSIGKIFGVESSIYFDYFTSLILIQGKHLNLIQDLEEFRKISIKTIFTSPDEFTLNFEKYLDDKNAIGPRKPGRITTGNKNCYIRDEHKLWRKLGLIGGKDGEPYLINGKFREFNWSRITEILTKDFVY